MLADYFWQQLNENQLEWLGPVNPFNDLKLRCFTSPQDGWTALMFAAYNGHTDIMLKLFERDVNTEAKNHVCLDKSIKLSIYLFE
jgi:ankyrin repeat protein